MSACSHDAVPAGTSLPVLLAGAVSCGSCMMASMNTETCDPDELAALREIFASRPEAAPPAGWEAVRSFEAEHGIVLPEPYRTFVAEICDGLRAGPPYYGLLPFAQTPPDWGSDRPERLLAEPFPLTEAWLWEAEGDEEALSVRKKSKPGQIPCSTTARCCWAPTAAACGVVRPPPATESSAPDRCLRKSTSPSRCRNRCRRGAGVPSRRYPTPPASRSSTHVGEGDWLRSSRSSTGRRTSSGARATPGP
ncbi:hypothetical protein STANM309S_06462 [Streptomyces tanashiensis]